MTDNELRQRLSDRKISAVAKATKIHANTIRRFINDTGKINESTKNALEKYVNE